MGKLSRTFSIMNSFNHILFYFPHRFFDGFIMQLKRAEEDGLLYDTAENYFHVEIDPKSAIDWCESQLISQGWSRSRLNRQNLVDVTAVSDKLKPNMEARR